MVKSNRLDMKRLDANGSILCYMVARVGLVGNAWEPMIQYFAAGSLGSPWLGTPGNRWLNTLLHGPKCRLGWESLGMPGSHLFNTLLPGPKESPWLGKPGNAREPSVQYLHVVEVVSGGEKSSPQVETVR